MENFIAEASSQARGYTRCGSELIVNEIANGTSNISHQDAFQVALKLAQQKADATLKEELMKIDMGNKPCIRLIGRPGVDGNRGKRGAKGDKGDAGAFPFELPSQFLRGNTFVIPDELLSEEQRIILFSFLDKSRDRQSREDNESANLAMTDLKKIQKQYITDLGPVVNNVSTIVDIAESYTNFTTNYLITKNTQTPNIITFIEFLYGEYPTEAECLVAVEAWDNTEVNGTTSHDVAWLVGIADLVPMVPL